MNGQRHGSLFAWKYMLSRGIDKQFKNILEVRNSISLFMQIAPKGQFCHVENLATTRIDNSYMECVLPADFQQPGSMLRLFRLLLGASGMNTRASPSVLWIPGLRIAFHGLLRPLESRQAYFLIEQLKLSIE
jgi:hypothetical protein